MARSTSHERGREYRLPLWRPFRRDPIADGLAMCPLGRVPFECFREQVVHSRVRGDQAGQPPIFRTRCWRALDGRAGAGHVSPEMLIKLVLVLEFVLVLDLVLVLESRLFTVKAVDLEGDGGVRGRSGGVVAARPDSEGDGEEERVVIDSDVDSCRVRSYSRTE